MKPAPDARSRAKLRKKAEPVVSPPKTELLAGHSAGALEIPEVRLLADRLYHLQRTQVFGEMARVVAHDFNNLLTVFHGYAEILQMETPPDDPRQEYLAEMLSAVRRARSLTDQLLHFCRPQPGSRSVFSLGQLLLDFHKLLRRIVPADVALELCAEEASGWVLADARQMEAVVLNLAVNACQAMPRGGRLSLRLEETASEVLLTVSDTGTGMAKAVLEHIFEPGFTTRPEGCGSGRGLSTCAAILAEHGGGIRAQSKPGKGSTFHVRLPRAQPPGEEAQEPAEPAVVDGAGRRVLVVDGDFPMQECVAGMLRRLGFEPVCASNGEQARRILEQEREIALVIAEVVMPLMGGIELAEIVHRQWPGTKILLTSGCLSEPPAANQTVLPPPAFLPKPLSRKLLVPKIRELLKC